jgi:phosphomannomutase
MPHPQIKFGTDGWRGLIADDFTFSNVRIAAQAIAAYLHARAGSENEYVSAFVKERGSAMSSIASHEEDGPPG